MRNIKLTIEYDGTDFYGWQVQSKGYRTIQGEIEVALKRIFKQKISLIGSGRTDSGVHAVGQIANFKTETSMELSEIVRALNANLPPDISILEATDVPNVFHSQFSAKNKTYRYVILNRHSRCSLQRRFVYYYPASLDIKSMRRAATMLKGRHDFRSLTASDPADNNKSKDTIRAISKITIKKQNNTLFIDVTANGFLYKMVRNIVGLLLAAGRGKISASNVKKIMAAKDRTKAGDTAPAHGLCLMQVRY